MALCSRLTMPALEGTGRLGCDMGPSGCRVAGQFEALIEPGHQIRNFGQPVFGTAVPGGATLPKVRLFIVDLAASCMKRRVLDRPTRSFG